MFSLRQWQGSNDWQNWVGYERAAPEQKLTPSSVAELQEIVKNARANKKRVRVTGAAHSFSGCAKPEEIAVSLHNMRGLILVDKEAKLATLHAGTYLYEIGPALKEHGLALENMGDVQAQTIAGAASTATHGTGITLGSIANQVVTLAHCHETAHSHRHLEWFLFPGTNKVQQKTLSVIAPKAMTGTQKLKDHFDSVVTLNGAFYVLCELARMKPSLTKKVSEISASSIPNTKREGYSYEVFPTPRGVKFNESEYFIKLSDFDECISEVNHILLNDNKGSHFPVEVRTHKGETGMLSPTQGEDCAVLSFHVYKGMDCEPLFKWLYEYMKKWQGRPHWGKVNKLSRIELQSLYPKLNRFLEIRREYDPDNVFMNSWLEQKFCLKPLTA